jgi:UDP-2,3-diacylglucosamine pyrophosphatase LpxH
MYDAIILSDIHLGADNCQAKRACQFLHRLVRGELCTNKLILNGDVFDSIDFRRLKKKHWKVLSLVRKLSDRMEIIWISGNHDGSTEFVSHLLGTTVVEEFILHSGGRKILVLHGHAFDEFLDAHPILTWIGDCIYFLLQRIDRTHRFAKFAKKSSKTFLRCARVIEEKSLDYARRKGCVAVCCGHTHVAAARYASAVQYFNCGCWTEWPGSYLTVIDGYVRLEHFATDADEAPVELLAEPGPDAAYPAAPALLDGPQFGLNAATADASLSLIPRDLRAGTRDGRRQARASLRALIRDPRPITADVLAGESIAG